MKLASYLKAVLTIGAWAIWTFYMANALMFAPGTAIVAMSIVLGATLIGKV